MRAELKAAIGNHERGRLDDAARVYDQILAENPQDAVVWNLSGVVAHQKGDHRRAIELINRAISLNAHEPAFHANVAEAYRAIGLYQQAALSCQTALQLEPNSPGAVNNLGLTWQALGRFEDAISQFETAIRMQPSFALAHNNLGTVLRHAGRTDEALDYFQQATQFDPNLAAAHSNLGQLLLERYQRQESLHHCLEAVRLQPYFPEAQNNLGNVFRELGRLKESQACYMEALRLNPGLALTCNNLGQSFQEQGDLETSLEWYRRGLSIDPGSARIHCNLGSLFQEREQYEIAIQHFDRALQLDPLFAEAYHGRGSIIHEQGDILSAKSHFREALRLRPNFAPAHCSMGTVHEESGDLDLAERSFREALLLDPDHSGAHAQLATLLRGRLLDSDLAASRQLAANPDLTDGKRSAIFFGLAHVDDARKDYLTAAEELRIANSLSLSDRTRRGQRYDPVLHDQFVDGLIETYTPAYFERVSGSGVASERPVFIIGLPRSGTTLTEQILASHPQVFGAGELGWAGSTFAKLPQIMSSDAPDWKCAGMIAEPFISDLARQLLDRLSQLDPLSQRIVDKMPDNYLYVGLIATLFPRARIIHCRRDLRDIAVSCWMTNFRQIRWANDQEHIAARFRAYHRLMQHWNQTLPTQILDVDYEETVSDVEGTARRLVSWLGLDWDPACAAFHENRRPVRTASVTQVRQPIYGSSVARWKHYESALSELFKSLPDE